MRNAQRASFKLQGEWAEQKHEPEQVPKAT